MTEETKLFFECLGEIWRDITAIEFLLRVAIARKDEDINKLPKPPYTKGKIYKEYPKAFSNMLFGAVVEKFNKYFPEIFLPSELVDLRNAFAHGLIAKIEHGKDDQLVKFKESKVKDSSEKQLKVEFSMALDSGTVSKMKEILRELRMKLANRFKD
jgi:hypothetical protein